MKTDRLIEILGTNIEPVSPRRLRVVVILALVAGAMGALCVMLATVGPRTDIGSHLPSLAIKLGFALAVAVAGSAFLVRSMRPGRHSQRLLAMWLPFIALGGAAVTALVIAEPASWGALVLGTAWLSCLICVPIFAAVPFAALISAARNGAPTSLARTGAAAGLVAGAFGVAAYALHGPDDFVPFIAVWYSAAIGLCALVGALLGRRLLQW